MVNPQKLNAANFVEANLPITLGLCAGVALEFLPPETTARLFTKDKYYEPMFGDAFPARTKARVCRTDD